MYFSFGFNICLCQLCQALKYGIFTRTPFAFRGVFLGGRCRKNLTDHFRKKFFRNKLISATSPPPSPKNFRSLYHFRGQKKFFGTINCQYFFYYSRFCYLYHSKWLFICIVICIVDYINIFSV